MASFYGTTSVGGASAGCGGDEGCGTVFKITPSGTLTTLYSFCSQANCADGIAPTAALVLTSNGDLYGTTSSGGAICCNGGTVFKMRLNGVLTTLHTFCSQGSGCGDGDRANALVQAANGDFYGTTQFGGPRGGGAIFKMTPEGVLKTLYGFCARRSCVDGYFPYAGLIQGTDGNFYGTTTAGGAENDGTVFAITPAGSLTLLHAFCSLSGCADGAIAIGALVQATNGNFYGTAEDGGGNGDGTIFSLSVALRPFVETQPTSGKVGMNVKILGTDLAGAASVKFNGVAAAFSVVSPTEITTTVPAGAATGTVQVTTPEAAHYREQRPISGAIKAVFRMKV